MLRTRLRPLVAGASLALLVLARPAARPGAATTADSPTRPIEAARVQADAIPPVAAMASSVVAAQVAGPVPSNATSYAFNAADHDVTPVDLASVGYLEQEYLVTGTANVYTWQGTSTTVAVAAWGPYVSRILVASRPVRRALVATSSSKP